MTAFITRFAPSPNGYLHLGHAFSALLAFYAARQNGGRFLLRIEDIDSGRARPHFETAIYQDLDWLGLQWEVPVLVQSHRFAVYEAMLKRLRDMELVYPCWATRSEIMRALAEQSPDAPPPRDPDGALLYPNIYRDIDTPTRQKLMWERKDYAWRLNMPKAIATAAQMTKTEWGFYESAASENADAAGFIDLAPEAYGDIIIARKEIPTSYHLSVVVDDAAQNITHIIRGHDLFAATHIHRLLQILLGFPAPRYHHHALMRDVNGRRLSKQAGDIGFRQLRIDGKTCDDVKSMLPDFTNLLPNL